MLQIINDGTMSEKTACHEIRAGDATQREVGKFCLHALYVQGSSEVSKRTHQGKTAEEKSVTGLTWK